MATRILMFTNKILPEFIYRQNEKDKFPERQQKSLYVLAEMLSTSLLVA